MRVKLIVSSTACPARQHSLPLLGDVLENPVRWLWLRGTQGLMKARTFRICPICGKKGLYSQSSSFYQTDSCRYCKSSWATHKWTSKTHRNTSTCPNCDYVSCIEGTVYPHYEPMPEEQIAKKIEGRKQRYQNRLKG